MESLLSLPYFRWHIIFVFIPTLLLWGFNYKYLLHYKKTFVLITVLSLIWGFIFDQVASVHYHLWFFNPTKNLGIWLWGLPVEEYIFLLMVPQALTALFLLMRRSINHAA